MNEPVGMPRSWGRRYAHNDLRAVVATSWTPIRLRTP
jgi:hypothetical protein